MMFMESSFIVFVEFVNSAVGSRGVAEVSFLGVDIRYRTTIGVSTGYDPVCNVLLHILPVNTVLEINALSFSHL